MEVNQNTSAEQLLLRRIATQLEEAGVRAIDRKELEDTLRRELDHLALSGDEEIALIPSGALSPGRVHAIDRFIAVRVERAVQAALEIGSRRAGLATPLVAPRVIVHRSRPASQEEMDLESRSKTSQEIRGPLPALAEKRLGELSRAGNGVLILADAPVVDGYLDRHVDLRIGDRGLGLHLRAGDEDTFLTIGESDPSAVHVLEFEPGFVRLEQVLEMAIRARFDLPARPSTGATTLPQIARRESALEGEPLPTTAPDLPEVSAWLDEPAADLEVAPQPDLVVDLSASDPAAETTPFDPHDSLVGTLFDGKYQILRRIGKGGFGVVYEARDVRLDHRIAIKLLHPDATRSPEELGAFKSEARRATRLSHPNIVDWKTFEETEDGTWYFVMELLEGEELDVVMKREGIMGAARVGRILLQVLDALRTAHNVGNGQSVLHLDLKPKNVFLIQGHAGASEERVKVIDFGIGQFVGAEEATDPTTPSSPTEPDGRVQDGPDGWEGAPGDAEQTLLTVHRFEDSPTAQGNGGASNAVRVQRSTACTPEYAAPEQCAHLLPEYEPEPLDGRADIYALGVIGFQMLTGQLPYEKSKRRKDLLHLKQSVEPRRVGSVGVRIPKDLAQFIDRCTARRRELRFRDAAEAYEALHAIVHRPLRKSVLVAATVFALLAVVTAWLVGRSLTQQGLDLYTKIDDVERSLASSRLYLGPSRASASVRISGLDSSAEIESVRIVDSRDAKAADVPGFRAVPQNDRHVLVSADPTTERIQRPVYLELRSPGKEPVWSVPFDIVWLGDAAWELQGVSVKDLAGRALDPSKVAIEVRVRGLSDDMSSVRIEHGEHTLEAHRDATLSRGTDGVYAVPLDALNLEAGDAEFRAVATDMAGRASAQTLKTQVTTGPILIGDASLDVTAVGGRYSISPRSDPNLHVKASRKADIKWTVRDENGGPLMTDVARGVPEKNIPLTGLTKLRGGSAFSGTIDVVVDETPYVLHVPATAGVAQKKLAFLFTDTAPDFSARLTTPDGGLGTTLDPAHPMFTARHDLVVHVGRENSLPIMVQVACSSTAHLDANVTLEPQLLVDSSKLAADFPLTLPNDGEYGLTVRVWRHDLPGQDTTHDPDAVLRARVVVDSSPAKIVVRGNAGIVLKSKAEPLPEVEVSVQDEGDSALVTRTPVDLRWDLVLVQRPTESLASGILGSVVPGGAPARLDLPAPWSLGAKAPLTHDGTYRILVQGSDAAGNPAEKAEIVYDCAVDGPELEVSRPVPRVPWPRTALGGFEIQVAARDPNGVADVRGIIRRTGVQDIKFQLHSTDDYRHTEISDWQGVVVFDESWSNSTVQVHLVAEDAFGTSKEMDTPRELGAVDLLLPLRMSVEFGGAQVETLRLVDGNAAGAYTFGGRVDAEEERAYVAAGLPPYNSLNPPRSWHVVYEAHEIPSFYLDEHEVSVAQYLAFVRADGGYAFPANWPDGATPDTGRRRELEQTLSAASGELPVADVTWDEAAAYAHWVGKRLPSLVEWEVAVRGNVLYRPFASAAKSARAPTRAESNYDPESAGDGAAWPCARGEDITPDTRIYDLCSNVAEWSATPASFLEGSATPLNLANHVLENRAGFLDARAHASPTRPQRYWVAGGSFQSSRADFSCLDRRPRGWHGPAVGFRCATDVASATTMQTSTAAGQPRFRGLFE